MLILFATATVAAASNCPTLDVPTRRCQEGLAKAGFIYARGALKAMQRCLKDVHAGNLAGDPVALCRGSLGVPPTDATTADKIVKAEQRAQKKIEKKCTDDTLVALEACGSTVAAAQTCVVQEHWQELQEGLDAAYGTLVPSGDRNQRSCQAAIAREGGKYLTSRMKALQRCLNTRNRACGTAAPIGHCINPSPTGAPEEIVLLEELARAETLLQTKLATICTDVEVAPLDACADTVGGVIACMKCAQNAAGDRIVAREYEAIGLATPTSTLAAALAAADEEDTILLVPGTYPEAVVVGKSSLQLLGQKDCATGDRAILENPGSAANGIASCGSLAVGCGAPADNLLFQGFEVHDYEANGILTTGTEGVTYRDMIAVGPGTPTGMEYGLFPVTSNNVLIEDSVVIGVRDAGIYVGQSTNIVVRNNEVYGNVAGIEIENSANAQVYGNYAHDNTGGILIFKLAGLAVQLSNCHEIYDNVSINNNTPNFGSGTVGLVPRGTGMLILSNDTTVIRDNTVTGNDTFGIAMTDQVILNILNPGDPPFPTPSPDPLCEHNYIVDNVLTGNGGDPDPAGGGFAADLLSVLSGGTGNCREGNTVDLAPVEVPPLATTCPGTTPPGCPYVPTTTTSTSTVTSTSTTTSTSIAPLTWTEIQGIFALNCTPCHTGGSEQYGFGQLDDYDAAYDEELIDIPSGQVPAMDRVEPGDASQSYLMHKLDGTHVSVGGILSQMPPGGPLPEATRDGIRAWIESGAPKN
jgi:parallel beta-helix repeat protein